MLASNDLSVTVNSMPVDLVPNPAAVITGVSLVANGIPVDLVPSPAAIAYLSNLLFQLVPTQDFKRLGLINL
jgi:hypothetical protein